jgi:hypothetical protein
MRLVWRIDVDIVDQVGSKFPGLHLGGRAPQRRRDAALVSALVGRGVSIP